MMTSQPRPTPGNDTAPSVGELMSPTPHTIDAHLPLAEAHARMRSNRIRHLPVTRDGALVGIVSLRDLHLLETLQDVDPEIVPVEEAMSERPVLVEPDTPIDKVAQLMVARRIGSVLVVDQGELRGIFTTIDALGALVRLWRGES